MATSLYQAGVEANNVELSYGLESVWGVAPATTFQAIRMTGETLSAKHTRSRPDEIRETAEAAESVLQSVMADGQINFALSYGVYDDLWASALNSAWAGLSTTIVGVAADIVFTAAGNTITSTTAGKFTTVILGQWLKITSPLNNGYGRVTAKPDNVTLTITGLTLVNETPAGAAAILKSNGYMRNSNTFQSLYIQKKLAAALWLRYPGSQVTGFSLDAQQGQFATGSFTLMAKNEEKATADAATGGIVVAPANRVYNTVAQFQQLQMDGATIAAVCRGVSIQVTKNSAGADYGVGSASAQGMRIGAFTVDNAKATFYFKDFTLYDMFIAESEHTFWYRQTDAAGNSYIFTFNAAVLTNPTIVAGGPNQPVLADFSLMLNPHATFSTLQLDRVAV